MGVSSIQRLERPLSRSGSPAGEWVEKVDLPPRKGKPVPTETFYRELLYCARQRGYRDGWAYWVFKDKVGRDPLPAESGPPVEPSEYTKWFVKAAYKAKARSETERRGE